MSTCKSCYKLPPSQARNSCKNTTKRLHTSQLRHYASTTINDGDTFLLISTPLHLRTVPVRFLGKPEIAEFKLTTLFFSSIDNDIKYWLPLLFLFLKLSNTSWTFYSSLMVKWLLWYATFVRSLGLPPLLSVSNCAEWRITIFAATGRQKEIILVHLSLIKYWTAVVNIRGKEYMNLNSY